MRTPRETARRGGRPGPLRTALLVAAVLAAVSPWRPGGSSDGLAVFRTAASVAFERTFVLPKAPPGALIDPFYFPPSPDGTGVVSVYAPFGALLGALLLRTASLVPWPSLAGLLADGLASAAPIAATALAVPLLARLLRHGGARKGPASALSAALVLGTFLGPLGVTDFQEPWLVLLVSLSLEGVLVARLSRGARRERALARAGLAFSMALLAKPSAAGVLPALVLAALAPRRGESRARSLLAFGLAAVPGVSLALSLNAVRFGSPFESGYGVQLAHPLARAVSPFWSALRLTVLPNRGLLWYAPLLVVAPFVLARLLRGRRRVVAGSAVLGFGAFFAANVAWFAWEGGFGWGPRLLAPAVVCAAPLLAVRGKGLRVAAALAALGAAANLPAALLEDGRLYRVAATDRAGEPLGPVVPIHRQSGGRGELAPLQRPHYVPRLAPVFLGPRLLAALPRDGDGPSAGRSGAPRTRDAALLRALLGQPRAGGSETGRLLATEALVTAGSDPARARRMASRAGTFGGAGPR